MRGVATGFLWEVLLLIDRRSFLQHLAGLSVTLAARGVCSAAARPVGPRPNIVVILADDVGYGDLSCYGATHVRTPRIDALATRGLRFTQAHTDAATCTPSRYAMLTGRYAWRQDGVQVLPGDAKLLIGSTQATIPSVLRSAGYRTGLVGKWHLGLGGGTIDWNGAIKPGPCEVGFDEAFFFAATADRVPTVYIHDHHVVNLDPKNPIAVSYTHKIGTEPTGKEDPALLTMKLSEGHDGTIVDGISRIGFMTGGASARWKDEEMAATFTGKAVEFIERNQDKPFLLYFTPSDIHVPRAPASQFAGKNECGVRCDVLDQLDWSVGQVMDTLKRLRLEENTLVLFTSDNGPVVNDGYDDGADRKLGAHRPAGDLRGGKYSIFEGGTTVPLLAHWPGTIRPGVSKALMSQVDLLASLAALVRQPVPRGEAMDSVNVLPALLGRSEVGVGFLVEEASVLAIREGQWKLIDRSQRPGIHPAPWDPGDAAKEVRDAGEIPLAELELYDLASDPRERTNVAREHPERVERLRKKLRLIRAEGRR